MANKMYYEQSYPTTKYEYSSRGYRNERMQAGDSRKPRNPYVEPPPMNPDYCCYENFQVEEDEDYRKVSGGQWGNLSECCIQKQKFHEPNKRSTKCQPAVNTPRYYRNMAHRRPSALCIPVLAQPESNVRRKSKSQSRVDGTERIEKELKGVRYRVRHPRHHLLPPPPTLPHYSQQQQQRHSLPSSPPPQQQPGEQTDIETSSGDGRRSLQSHTQSSGSLSVDISSQVETLNQSFNAVTKERRGKKKIIYGDLEPVFTNVESGYSNPNNKSRKLHRRHSRRHKHNEPLENWTSELVDLPEETPSQDWLDKAETDWVNLEQRNSYPVNYALMADSTDHPFRNTGSRKHHQTHPHHQYHYPPQQSIPQPPQNVPSKLLNPNLPRPRTRGSHSSSKDSQDAQTNEVPTVKESSPSNNEDKVEKKNFLENLFSEVFAQGCVDNLSKRTRLDFIKEAYDKYSASLDETGKTNSVKSKEEACNSESSPFNKLRGDEIQWHDEFIDPDLVQNRQMNHITLLERTNSKTEKNSSGNDNNANIGKIVNEEQKGPASFFLSVKPRRRSVKMNEDEVAPEETNQTNIPKFLEKENTKISKFPDSIPRFPNLIENMSARYVGSSSPRASQTKAPENTSNQKTPSATSNTSNSFNAQKQSSKEYCNQVSGKKKEFTSMPQTRREMNSDAYSKMEIKNDNRDSSPIRFSAGQLNKKTDDAYRKQPISQLNQPYETVSYANPNNSNYLNNEFCNHQGEKRNYSNENFNRLNDNNLYSNKESYSSNMQNNYMTIKRCQEILNQVKENLGENMMTNPDDFQTDGHNRVEINKQATYTTVMPDYLDHSPSVIMNSHKEFVSNDERGCTSKENETGIPFPTSHSVSLSNERAYRSESCSGVCRCQGDSGQSNLMQNLTLNEPRKSTQVQGGQENIYSQEDRKITDNSNVASDELGTIEQYTDENQQAKIYDEIDEEKVKQFIHTLTGFDSLKNGESKLEMSKYTEYNEKFHRSDSKHNFQQSNFSEAYARTVSPKLSTLDNNYSLKHHDNYEVNLYSDQQHCQLKKTRSKTYDETKMERQVYSIPQRKEIERMKQEAIKNRNLFNQKNEDLDVCSRNSSAEIPEQNMKTLNQMSYMGPQETENSDLHRIRKARNKMNLVNHKNYRNDNIKEGFNQLNVSENLSDPYQCDINNAQEMDRSTFYQNPELFIQSTVNENVPVVESQEGPHNANNYGEENYDNSYEVDYNTTQTHQQFYNYEHHLNATSHNDQQYLNDNVDDINFPACLSNNEGEFGVCNEMPASDFPVAENSEEAKSTVVKRKYYFMPSENYGAQAENYGSGSMSDQSYYKSYIENIIDSSLQPVGNESPGSRQIIKQGAIHQHQSDVVELETDKAIDLVLNESSCQMDSKLCLEITQRLTDTLVQSQKDIPTPCLVALEEPVYLQQLKRLRWDHLRHIEREVKRLESLERFLDTCGCGHMMFTKNNS